MKHCAKCGYEMEDSASRCPRCGSYAKEDIQAELCRFDGSFWPYFGRLILCALMSIFTLGVCYPFGMVMVTRYEKQHTVISGRRLSFDGSGGEFIGRWLLYELLMIVTCGIYGLWVPVKVYEWQVEHTHFEGYDENAYYQSHGSSTPASYYDGGYLQYIGWLLSSSVLALMLLGFLVPFGFEGLFRAQYNNTVIDGRRLSFVGTGNTFAGTFLGYTVLTFLTCGIFGAWVPFAIKRWEIQNLTIAEPEAGHESGGGKGQGGNVEDQDRDDSTPTTPLKEKGYIVCTFGVDRGCEYPAAAGEELLIGTDPASVNIIVTEFDRGISRKHCGITFISSRNNGSGTYRVIDYSTNGTYINDSRIIRGREYTAHTGDTISLAVKECSFRLG